MEPNAETDTPQLEKPAVIYGCTKCKRIIASQENVVQHERGKGEESFRWRKRMGDQKEWEKDLVDCSSILVEPMKWMQIVQEGYVEEKLLCMGCNARLGSFNWAGIQCNCGAWVNPAVQLHKSRLEECHM